MITVGNLLSNARVLVDAWRVDRNDVLLHALPIFHTHGLFVGLNVMLLAGGSLIFLNRFDVDQVVAELPRATMLMGVPTYYTRLLGHPELDGASRNVRVFISGSAPLLEETHRHFERLTGHKILERYGMTETGMNTSNPYDGDRRPGSVGVPLDGVQLRVADADGLEVAPGDIGNIEVRGANVFTGYWGMPEKTRAEIRADGFFITGDLGRIDKDGYVFIVGRQKDLIITGGLNVYPKEVEAEIDCIAGVQESAVIGLPHPDLGEAVTAIVVCQPEANLQEHDVTVALRDRLARFKQPKRVIVLSHLPRNAMGKVQKAELRERFNALYENKPASE
jgi:malonyl-CoA/methylmalonyl-CoA synthetase